jgi:predicted DNA-binding transcriptional regulator AlpA
VACRSDPAVSLPACRISGSAYSEESRSRLAPSPTPTARRVSFGLAVSMGCLKLAFLPVIGARGIRLRQPSLVQHRYRLSKLRDVLLRGDEVNLWKVTDVAEFLGVSTQRVDQLALAGRFPPPSGRLGRARYWERSDVEAWAEGNWWAGDGRRRRQR